MGQMWAHPSLTPSVCFEDTSSSIYPAPPPLPSDRVASVGWKPQSGNLAKRGRGGTPFSTALLRVGWFLFVIACEVWGCGVGPGAACC